MVAADAHPLVRLLDAVRTLEPLIRAQAEEAARVHNAERHGGKPWALVYEASFWRCLSDHGKDSY